MSKRQRRVSRKTQNRRLQLLSESAYKLGYATGAKEMASRSAQIMQQHLDEQAMLRYVGDLFGYIGMAVAVEANVLANGEFK